jgi:altronate hydrolase
VATRNYIGVLTSVNCSATVARAIADHFRRDIHPEPGRLPERRRRGGADPRHGLRHRQRRRGTAVLRRTLGGYARHANFFAVLVVGPGLRDQPDPGLLAQEGLQKAPSWRPSASRTPAARREDRGRASR